MRVKSLAAAVGLSVVAAVALGQGVSSANRGTDPLVEPRIETPAEPVEETPATPAEETPTAPAVEETPTPPVVEEPAPAPTTTTTLPPAAPTTTTTQKPAVPVTTVEAPIAPLEKKKDAPAPAPSAKPDPAPQSGDACHMDSYEPADVDSFSPGTGERARAEKVDRNGNGVVCRKDIPGKGKGNTKQNSNIKDDQVR